MKGGEDKAMTRIRQSCDKENVVRLMDARHHFLGLLKKGGEVLVYCRKCQRFFSVILQAFHREPASRSPIDRLG